jgi:hypothetical protein
MKDRATRLQGVAELLYKGTKAAQWGLVGFNAVVYLWYTPITGQVLRTIADQVGGPGTAQHLDAFNFYGIGQAYNFNPNNALFIGAANFIAAKLD